MKEYIEREAALNASKILYIEYIEEDEDGYEEGNADEIPVVFKRDIENIPAADVRENVHGEWTSQDGISICSNCGKAAPYDVEGDIIMYWPNLNYCPNCGADMRGEEDETD